MREYGLVTPPRDDLPPTPLRRIMVLFPCAFTVAYFGSNHIRSDSLLRPCDDAPHG